MHTRVSAFTLIELLVVIAIIGILASVVTVNVGSSRNKARAVKVQADFKQILTAIDVARNDKDVVLGEVTGNYCTDCGARHWYGDNPSYDCRSIDLSQITPTSPDACIQTWDGALVKIGLSPGIRDPWGSPYLLDENEHEGDPANCSYDGIWTAGPDRKGGGGDDVGTTIPHYSCR